MGMEMWEWKCRNLGLWGYGNVGCGGYRWVSRVKGE